MRRLSSAIFVVLFSAFVALFAGCRGSAAMHYFESDTTSNGDGGSGTTTTSSADAVCDGECYLWNSALFEDLSLFWIGPPGAAPPCPETAPALGAVLYADPQPSPYVCPACSCLPAGCAVPEEMHVSAAKCPGDGAAAIAWDSPAWDGDCTADGAIAPGLMCAGVPCTQSITIAAPRVEPCAPVSEGEEVPTAAVWGRMARECILGPLSGDGCGGSEACLPPPLAGFSLCLYRWGDALSPEYCPEEYPRHLVMYADNDDTRGCEPCACAEPQGAECSALVSLFPDSACGTLLGAFPVSTAVDDACFDLLPGVGLGSKAGVLTENKPGSCAPSGGPMGNLAPTVPLTLCCQPDSQEVP